MKFRLNDLAEVGSSKRIYAKEYKSSGIPFYRGKEIIAKSEGRKIDNSLFISKDRYNTLLKKCGVPKENDILISAVGTIGKVYHVAKSDIPFYFKDGNLIRIYNYNYSLIDPYYLYYLLKSYCGQNAIRKIEIGSTQKAITINELSSIVLDIPSLQKQQEISNKLKKIDALISVNSEINDNLLELAKAVFNKNVNSCSKTLLSNYFLPKRGKNLVKKNVIPGTIPVIAGGMIPAAFHNKSNTMAPVITISASGANAGYVQIWGIKVWSSDSSFVDESVSNNIYFWYLLLKKYQKQIYESQTGSAQPHIYPKNIGNLLIPMVSDETRLNINEKVKPIFNNIFKNKHENNLLNNLKIILLEKYF
ncbi:restriction endonuclease subunit S [Lactobacillus helsingborgensis]|uniref:restriction endonuclease subunit S n=1 Tax=Lactobacillus helsingborgensis TaxID=1218494 RepID=UPI00274238F4|nr:restriction endonuclease subunit S [Lactobacillus helsingborgensis]WLT00935.1 restriction endonuclease subunit S [Lactobacillus helsingborgensis]